MQKSHLVALLVAALVPACTLVAGDYTLVDGSPDASPGDVGGDTSTPLACDAVVDCPVVPSGTVDCIGGRCELSCAGQRQNCDGDYATGCETPTDSDLGHCGGCGEVCDFDGASESCVDGECVFDACNDGREDCENGLIDGCEANLGAPTSCGSCTPCPSETPLCNERGPDDFECVLNCPDTVCDGSCVDTASSAGHCGMCGDACPMAARAQPTCEASTCGFRCDEDFADCNMNGSDGCEADLRIDPAHCGECGDACEGASALWACTDRSCEVLGCQSSDFVDCNGVDADGCEVSIQTDSSHCGGCNISCDGVCEDGFCDPVEEVSSSSEVTCARRRSGAVLCWGLGDRRQTGTGEASPSPFPSVVMFDGAPLLASDVKTGRGHACAIDLGGHVVCWGSGTYGEIGVGQGNFNASQVVGDDTFDARTFVSVALGSFQSCALDDEGEVWCLGRNDGGELGTTPSSAVVEPTRVPGITGATQLTYGSDHGCVLLTGGTVSCWGRNRFGGVGHGAVGSFVPSGDVGVSNVREVATGDYHTCAVDDTGALYCWGRNSGYQLGNTGPDTNTPNMIPSIMNIEGLSGGNEHTCGHIDGEPRCWGRRNSGALGDGSVGVATPTPTAAQGIAGDARVFAGTGGSCAIEEGRLSCWGSNLNGVLGVDDTAVPPPGTNIAGLTSITALSTSSDSSDRSPHGCAIAAGAAYCWGAGAYGQTGAGTTVTNIPRPLITLLNVTSVHTVGLGSIVVAGAQAYAFGANTSGRLGDGSTSRVNAPTLVDLAGDEDEAVLGSAHGCARQGGSVYCWGSDAFGQLGRGVDVGGDLSPGEPVADISDATSLVSGSDFACVLRASGDVACWGRNDDQQLGGAGANANAPRVLALGSILALSAGHRHACAIVGASLPGQVYCWGANDEGQSGQVASPSADPLAVTGLSDAIDVVAYGRHSCAVRVDGSVWCWGSNADYQFGDGTNVSSRTPVEALGITDAIRLGEGGGGTGVSSVNTCAVRESGDATCWGG
ncbi:MAG: alpha-tubulin suppressor-like RCC1 family protein, partial [Polyangiales bacterium]